MSNKIDFKNQISFQCAVNNAILNELRSSNSNDFIDACINTPIKFGIKPPNEGDVWPFFNYSWMVSIMYCMFVVSREIYNIDNKDCYFVELKSKNVFKEFTILKQKHTFNDNPLYHFKCLRNSVSHVNYNIDENSIEFWDHHPKKSLQKDWHWHVKINHDDFWSFLGNVSDANLTFYKEIKSGERNSKGEKN